MACDFARIVQEQMIEDKGDALERNFELAKRFISITSKGKVNVKVKEKLTNRLKVALYLLGKHYAILAGKVQSALVRNEELANELELPNGSVFYAVKELRDRKIVRTEKFENGSAHMIPLNRVERLLKEVEELLKKTED